MAEDRDGRLWIGTSHGVAYRSGNAFEVVDLPPALLTRIVLALHTQADGTVWFGTLGGGLVRYASGSTVAVTTREGFPDNTIYGIVDDGMGFFWLSSNRGLFRVAIEELERLASGHADAVSPVLFGYHDGMPSEACRGFGQPAGCRARDGRLWFPTDRGIAVIDPNRLSTSEGGPPVVIERLVIDGRAIEPREHIEIGPDGRQFEFHFTGLSYADPQRVRFKYRLEGFDSDWIEADTRRTAYYTRLPPGSYRFHVTACNNDGVWNPNGASMTLAIVPHFWQRGWFLWGTVLASVVGIVGAVRRVSTVKLNRKLRQLERQQALESERARIAQDLHDEVGANLTRIGRLAEIAKCDEGADNELAPILDSIASETANVVQAMDEIVWTVNPGNDSLENMAGYLLYYTEEFLRNTGITYQFDVPVILPDVTLSAEERHNLFMVVKEALSNAVRHGKPCNVSLKLEAANGVLMTRVKDDGIGFVLTETAPGADGIDNMRRRMETIGGNLDLRSTPDGETTVTMLLRYVFDSKP
jgi:signal transduction histidine kinase